ncbi:MAG: alpha/beta hydrolase-fold protein [Gemmatimonadaceae bacterium]
MRSLSRVALLLAATSSLAAQAPRFEVRISPTVASAPVTGRLVLLISKTAQPEPRVALSLRGPTIAGVDLEQVRPEQPIVVDDAAVAYPARLSSLPPGDYFVQAVVNVYDPVRRADGKTLWLPTNDGTIEFFTTAGGNLYSDVVPLRIGSGEVTKVEITRTLPATPKPRDTDWIKYVSIQSKKLTQFWGRPIYVHAAVLLPKGYDEHPNTYYPSVYTLGHSWVPLSFRTTPPSGQGSSGVSPVTGLENGYETFKHWTSDGFPRVVAISLIQQTPYFPDSYSVNSANNGPYGDAIVEEVIPWLEEHFRLIRKPYARHLEGASTSGWQTLALQLRNPDLFGGAWVLQPDPIDFTRYISTNIYEDTNAFVIPLGPFLTAERGFQRARDGQVMHSMRQLSLFEAVLGSRGRSGFQLAAWEAVYGPADAEGYPKPLWNKLTGTIDRSVANYMRDNGYDLRAYAEKNWATLGPKLAGKLHFFAGDMDDFSLNLAVYRFEEFLKGTTNPKSDADFTYGRPMKGHSWHAWTWAEFIRLAGARIKASAPASENTKSWNY